jgi:hypothetical protein
MITSRFWLRDLIVAKAKTKTGWTLSCTKEHGDKLELVLNGLSARYWRQNVLAGNEASPDVGS